MGEGIKYDQGKARLGEMIIDFKEPLEAVCSVWNFGATKYGKSNWKYVDNAIERYTNAMVRHLVAEEMEVVDPESEFLHATHVAWNALARLYFIKMQMSLFANGATAQAVKDTTPGAITKVER